ncbi:MAG TPA: disulfide bond formation protein B [Steroidobacteraceae bacterium]|jgi:disulfide bond formation protein DsbB|nr:disulfide bond formation protein B [Steroidobacteraceae bacterium]
MLNRRLINFAGAAACLGMFAFALYTQYFENYEPCPLCIFQRITVVVLGMAFLVAAIHNPRRGGAWVYAGLIGVLALISIGVSARHVYIQSQPPGSIPACGAPLNVLLQMFHFWQVVVKVLHAGGECAVINWTLWGVSMPAWVLFCALILGGAGVIANIPRRPPTLRMR